MPEKLPESLLNLIKTGEKITTELKTAKSVLPENLFDSVCSMLNRCGGHIFLGVDDNRNIVGVDSNSYAKMEKDFINLCNNPKKLHPTQYITIYDYEYDGKIILYIPIYESEFVHDHAGVVFDRNGEGDYRVTDPTRISKIYARKQRENYEDDLFPFATMSDLRPDLIKRARQMAINNSTDTHIWATMSDEEILRSLNFLKTDLKTGKVGLTLAAILLFGKDETITSAIPWHRTDAIYRVKNVDRYDDRDDIRTNLLDTYDRLMAFVKKHLNDMFYIEGSQRIDVRAKIAREISSNILMHRNYLSRFVPKLVIEKDRMFTENGNIAKRVGTIDVNKFTPYSKNPKIAKVFKEIGLADELGSGVRNITKYTKIYSESEPIFEEDDEIFTTIIPLKPVVNVPIGDVIEDENGTLNGTLKAENGTLNGTLNKIVQEIKENKYITAEELAEKLGLGVRTIKRKLKELQEQNIILRENGKRDGYWKVLK